jgi:hypothetical protein
MWTKKIDTPVRCEKQSFKWMKQTDGLVGNYLTKQAKQNDAPVENRERTDTPLEILISRYIIIDHIVVCIFSETIRTVRQRLK